VGRQTPTLRVSGFALGHDFVEEQDLDGNHLVLSCNLADGISKTPSYALIDCAATGYACVDEEFACHHHLPLYALKNPCNIEVIDGRPIESGQVTHLAKTTLTINGHTEAIVMFVTKLGHYPIVFGIPWLRRHDVSIKWSTNTVTFDSDFCLRCCVESPAQIKGISTPLPDPPAHRIAMIACSTFCRMANRKNHNNTFGKITIYKINNALKPPKDLEEEQIAKMVPAKYHQFLPMFRKSLANKLPAHRPYDYRIDLQPDFTPPFGPLYSPTKSDLETLREWLNDNLSKGFI